MKHPVLKNYFSVRCVQTIGELWGILHKDKSVFVRSWNRVHPCKFFLNNDLHFTIKRLEEMIENREFYRVVSKKSAGIQSLGEYIKQSNALIFISTGIPLECLSKRIERQKVINEIRDNFVKRKLQETLDGIWENYKQ